MKFLRGTLMGLFCLVVGFLVVWQPMATQAQGAAPTKGKPALYEFGAKTCIPMQRDERGNGGFENQPWRPGGISHGVFG